MPDFNTWTALLAHWTDMARLARAIDQVDDGPMSLALPHIITCQALMHALPDVLKLPEGERSHAFDLAAVALTRLDEACESTFTTMPQVLLEARGDAELALEETRLQCCWMLIWDGDVPLVVPQRPQGVPAHGDEGTLLLALPGTILLPGTPVAGGQTELSPCLVTLCPGCVRDLCWRACNFGGLQMNVASGAAM